MRYCRNEHTPLKSVKTGTPQLPSLVHTGTSSALNSSSELDRPAAPPLRLPSLPPSPPWRLLPAQLGAAPPLTVCAASPGAGASACSCAAKRTIRLRANPIIWLL
eukprot:350730-Chlamydomonas_euryale.AAC.11